LYFLPLPHSATGGQLVRRIQAEEVMEIATLDLRAAKLVEN
jgi:hypothetical protein